ncbi:serine/threonine protein kinase [Rosenbergiella australiborealis]|uniref:serine/threonine protein kinase n=1 Tax=Rosenbergiella australiborealis TaxID=1544696 RepID=UPI001F4D7E55|nr:serine/threonine protein kinase [Rosenbergiella australiborealis]
MTEPSFDFQTLDPETVVDSLWNTGIRVDSGLTPLNSYENRVWQLSDEDRHRYVAKYYRPQRWSKEQLSEEHHFTLELAEAGISVAAPLSYNNSTLQQTQGIWFAIFPSMGGRQYEIDNYEHLEQAAQTLARIHQVGRRSQFQYRPTFGLEEYFYQPFNLLSESPLVPTALKANFVAVLKELGDQLSTVWHTNWDSLRLHGDCHPGNILWREGPLFVDLDDARNGPAVQDLWMLVTGDLNEQRVQWDILLECYTELTEFNVDELSLIEPLRAMRMVYYLAWVVRRWQDPAFPKAFPWFKEVDFWHRQITQMRTQIALLQSPPSLVLSQF